MSKIQILWSIDPVMTSLAIAATLMCGFVLFLIEYGLLSERLWDGGEDVLICEEK